MESGGKRSQFIPLRIINMAAVCWLSEQQRLFTPVVEKEWVEEREMEMAEKEENN
jgi:hypothetical protein